MSKVWIDLSDISVWSGHHTGTQRVVYEIAKEYEGKTNVGFFIFNPKQNTFHEHPFSGIRESVEASKQDVGHNISAGPKVTQHLRSVAARVYHNSPESVKRRLTRDRRRKIKRVLKSAKHLVKPVRLTVAEPTSPAIHFAANDVVLILGKPWDYKDLITTLAKEKSLHHFKIVEVVYDLIPVYFPHLFGLALFKPYVTHMFESVEAADSLLAISESTKVDTQKFCKEMLLPEPPIEVIRLGDDFAQVEPKNPNLANIEPGNFILCVGTVEVRKNHQLLYMAYKEGLARGMEMPRLVIVGGKGWYTSDVLFAFGHDPQIRDITHIGGRNDQELEWLYQNCLFTIYPSVYEGWGLPIAESLARGKVCISSNTSSMTEIAGNLIEYFSPYDSKACLDLIERYSDKSIRTKKESEIKKQYTPATWHQTYKQVEAIVKSVAS